MSRKGPQARRGGFREIGPRKGPQARRGGFREIVEGQGTEFVASRVEKLLYVGHVVDPDRTGTGSWSNIEQYSVFVDEIVCYVGS